ncbi:unnamed protein product [Rotaria sp. Silwood1]|nr:unnamed protein product [Rotaria sp. Silwood1]CAF1621478.1 unnamed protein product [Rotaria sp. Silwood1]CAF3795387.1 unnamed protein product [Rotaria sp. Silwood1]CAF3828055.1 unnamed protein product [Rotaria sp. Silwood1]CAF3840383.1 unnamed protein product [Rotaria sp. Silwood1]
MNNSIIETTQNIIDDKDTTVSNSTRLLSASSKIKSKIMSPFCISIDDDPLILLNIGGTHMTTRRSTLMRIPNSVLALACINPWSENLTHDNDGRLFFDCDPNLFQYLLNQLRNWSSSIRQVFILPNDEFERERFRSFCIQFNIDLNLIDGIYRYEKFNKICGHIIIDENGLIVKHANNYRYAECRGINVYSTGINRIKLILKHETIDKYNTFIGIIWSGSPMQEKSFELSTSYGWSGQKQVYLKGIPTLIQGYGGYDSDMCTKDIVDLILNCQLGLISLYNYRTKKNYEIKIDIKEGCPLPWQLHINLFGPNDQVKIINPSS